MVVCEDDLNYLNSEEAKDNPKDLDKINVEEKYIAKEKKKGNSLEYSINSFNQHLPGSVSFVSSLLRPPADNRLQRRHVETAEALEKALINKWQEMDRMLICSKVSTCVLQYNKTVKIGGKDVKANLIQSLSITVHQIREITNKLKKTNW